MLVAQRQQAFSLSMTQYTAGDCNVSARSEARLSGTVESRSFSSRHVPGVVEGLKTAVLPTGQRQLQGLLAHLKQASSASDERLKQALATDAEGLVPEEFTELLRAEFERRCCFGDRSNTEYMNSAKWKKLLQECGIISGLHGFRTVNQQQTGRVTLAAADTVFHKVLHDQEYGSKRLNYELFCKALLLVAAQAYPDLDVCGAFAEILVQVAACSGGRLESETQPGDNAADLLLHPNVVVTLDNFKPALYDLFQAVCGLKLDNPAQAKPGLGSIRSRERTYMKYAGTQDATSRVSLSMATLDRALASHGQAPLSRHSVGSVCSGSTCEPKDCGVETGRTGSEHSDVENEVSNRLPELPEMDKVKLIEQQQDEEWEASSPEQDMATVSSVEDHNASYVNGMPTLRDRSRRMSFEQMMLMCTRLGIVPEFLTQLEVVSVFKRAQHTGYSNGLGSSLSGFLSYEEFMDAIGQLAIKAYSKQPFAEEYPEAHEKIEAFLLRMLPSDQRELLEKFHYGRQ